jgi:hypothetical protein
MSSRLGMTQKSLPFERDKDLKRVLPESARQRGRLIASDKVLAIEFLKRAGILGEDGRLTEHYR